jgi:hypothetical protein
VLVLVGHARCLDGPPALLRDFAINHRPVEELTGSRSDRAQHGRMRRLRDGPSIAHPREMLPRRTLLAILFLATSATVVHAEPGHLSQGAALVGISDGGLDLELDVRPVRHLELSASLSNVDARLGFLGETTWKGRRRSFTPRLLLPIGTHFAFQGGIGVGWESVDRQEHPFCLAWDGQGRCDTPPAKHLEGAFTRGDVGMTVEVDHMTARVAVGLDGIDHHPFAMAGIGAAF